MITDPIADLLTHVRNAYRAGHPSVLTPGSTLKARVLTVLAEQGYIERFESIDKDGHTMLKIYLSYAKEGTPVLREIKRLSRPGKRLYVPGSEVPREKNGLGTVIISTSQGVMSDQEARKRGIGGELICSVF